MRSIFSTSKRVFTGRLGRETVLLEPEKFIDFYLFGIIMFMIESRLPETVRQDQVRTDFVLFQSKKLSNRLSV